MYTSTDFDISEKINYHLLAYFLSHISAENYKIRLMQAEFIASWSVSFLDTVQQVGQLNKMYLESSETVEGMLTVCT